MRPTKQQNCVYRLLIERKLTLQGKQNTASSRRPAFRALSALLSISAWSELRLFFQV